ncbi:MAG TPA: hypothetical protein VFG84_03990 [Gemmatimonadaceae bacterium]|nr:hypothetical protein [Gemmatimonadaceae bacterium]
MTSPQRSPAHAPHGYGNIYTPHAGSMIIQVQRESGLANRTIILGQRQVRLLRLLWSPLGRLLVGVLAVSWILFAIESARVPALRARVAELEGNTVRLDSLQVALSRLHVRYEQVRNLMSLSAPAGATRSAPDTPPVASTRAPATAPVGPQE